MDEAHLSKLSIHPGSSKMYQDLKSHFWWTKMKKEIAAYVARCDTCCRVKAIQMKPAGLLQPLSVPEWKWEEVSVDIWERKKELIRKRTDIGEHFTREVI